MRLKTLLHVFAALGVNGNDCSDPPSLEMLLLMDISAGLWSDVYETFSRNLEVVLENITREFPQSKMALATFSDKPLPHSGQGDFGGYQESPIQDTCYQLNTPFSQGETDIKSLIRQLEELTILAGLDIEEAQLDALVRGVTDPNVRWSPRSANKKKVVVMFTDSVGHEANWKNASTWVEGWNVTTECTSDHKTTGGWGSQDFPPPNVELRSFTYFPELYPEFVSLKRKLICDEDMTGAETTRLLDLLIKLWPEKWPIPLKEHPGDNSLSCETTEYPSYKLVTDTLLREEINLLVLYMPSPPLPDVFNIWEWIATDPEGLGTTSIQLTKIGRDMNNMDHLIVGGLEDLLNWKPCHLN